MNSNRVVRIFYTLLWCLILPLVFVRLWLRGSKSPEYRNRWGERLGINQVSSTRGGVWVHAVSLGESIAATPLIEALLARFTGQVVVTCMTPTGSAHIVKTFGDKVQHVYLPYDLPWLLKPLVKKVQASRLVIMETELWPNLLQVAKDSGMKTLLVNARLSEKSAQGYARVAPLTQWMLSQLDVIAAQYDNDAQRFAKLGYPREQIHVTGNMKVDIEPPTALLELGRELRHAVEDRPVLLFASTHTGEEALALKVYQALNDIEGLLLVVVPRHPERFEQVEDLLKRSGLNRARRSLQQRIETTTQVYLADTMGELWAMYEMADLAVVGGSFNSNGGHNPLEPAALGKMTIIGPSYFNFSAIVDLLSDGGGLEICSERQLLERARYYLQNRSDSLKKGQVSRVVIEENRGAFSRIVKLVTF